MLYVGTSSTSIAGRVAAIEATTLGDRRPHSGGHWLKLLTGLERARVWWARTDATEEYEDALYAAFAEGVPAADRALLHDHDVVLPFANLRSTAGDRKAHGLTAYLVPDDAQPQRKVATRVTELPAGDADGATGLPPTRAAGGTTRRAPRAKAVTPAAPGPTPRAPAAPPSAAAEAGPTYLSAEGIARLRAELAELTTVRRPEVIARIKSAKELGDLKENADYTAAREEQSFLEGRIATIEGLLRTAVVIEAHGADGRAHVGSRVSVEEIGGDDDVVVYRIVGSAEADPAAGRISNVSPVGRALIGRSIGDVVTVTTPRGAVEYRIIAVE